VSIFAADRICILAAELIIGIAVNAAIMIIAITIRSSTKVKPPLMPRKPYPAFLLKYE
jgi:hypothetical protein